MYSSDNQCIWGEQPKMKHWCKSAYLGLYFSDMRIYVGIGCALSLRFL